MSPDRRNFIGASAVAVFGAFGLYEGRGGASRFNDWFSERLFSTSREAPKFDVSARSTNFPNYHIATDTPALAKPEEYRLEVGGLVRTPLSLTVDDVKALNRLTYTVEHHCVEGWSAVATWSGAPLRTIADKAGVKPEARYVRFDSFDEDYFNGWDLVSAMHKETMLAYGFNDRDITPEHGAPLRLYAPHKLGYKLTKYVTKITFTAEKPGGYWEDQGYPWLGGV
jgi:DMSO/TMAO reductase YedYZ molybdopterin-dependent catalytic subunit